MCLLNRPTGFSRIALRIDWPIVLPCVVVLTSALYPPLTLLPPSREHCMLPLALTLPSRDRRQYSWGALVPPGVCTKLMTPPRVSHALRFVLSFHFLCDMGPFRNYCHGAIPATTSKPRTRLPSGFPNVDDHLPDNAATTTTATPTPFHPTTTTST